MKKERIQKSFQRNQVYTVIPLIKKPTSVFEDVMIVLDELGLQCWEIFRSKLIWYLRTIQNVTRIQVLSEDTKKRLNTHERAVVVYSTSNDTRLFNSLSK